MPIFTYFSVVGTALVALLFALDAILPPRGPLWFTNNSVGLPQSSVARPQDLTSSITPAAPGPNTSSQITSTAHSPVEIRAFSTAETREVVPLVTGLATNTASAAINTDIPKLTTIGMQKPKAFSAAARNSMAMDHSATAPTVSFPGHDRHMPQ
jgi:hypothetical protein